MDGSVFGSRAGTAARQAWWRAGLFVLAMAIAMGFPIGTTHAAPPTSKTAVPSPPLATGEASFFDEQWKLLGGAFGACCLPAAGGGGTPCIITTECDCQTKAGVWFPGLDCSDVQCTGACCLTDGSCLSGQPGNASNCQKNGGVFYPGAACGAATCNVPCCLPDGTCGYLSTQACWEAGGWPLQAEFFCRSCELRTEKSECGPLPADFCDLCLNLGSCTFFDDFTDPGNPQFVCEQLTVAQCAAVGGWFLGYDPGLCAAVTSPAERFVVRYARESFQEFSGAPATVYLPRFDAQDPYRVLRSAKVVITGRTSSDVGTFNNSGRALLLDVAQTGREAGYRVPGLIEPVGLDPYVVLISSPSGGVPLFFVTGLELGSPACLILDLSNLPSGGLNTNPEFTADLLVPGLPTALIRRDAAHLFGDPADLNFLRYEGVGSRYFPFEHRSFAQSFGNSGANFGFTFFPEFACGTVEVIYEFDILGACCFCPEDFDPDNPATYIFCEDGLTLEQCQAIPGYYSWTPFASCAEVQSAPDSDCHLGSCCIYDSMLDTIDCISGIPEICCDLLAEDPNKHAIWAPADINDCEVAVSCCIQMDDLVDECIDIEVRCYETSPYCCSWLAGLLGGVKYEAVEDASCDPKGICCIPYSATEGVTVYCISEECCDALFGELGAIFQPIDPMTETCDDPDLVPAPCDCDPPPPGCLICREKGSLVIFSKVEVRWDAEGNLLQDTFISLTNDWIHPVKVLMYFVNGDEPLEETDTERAHPGWNYLDNAITLTQNQPIVWSAATGDPYNLSPWTALDPGFPPGRPAMDGTNERVLRGFIYAWAVNDDDHQIRWNHLSGTGTLVYYTNGMYAWEYTACTAAVQANVANGAPFGIKGILKFNGQEYCQVPSDLLLSFQSVGSVAWSGTLVPLTIDTDVTLHPVSADFRPNLPPAPNRPVSTFASYNIWNENEQKFSSGRCITCWDQSFLSMYGAFPNIFAVDVLGTDAGKARIRGVGNVLCNVDGRISERAGLIGLYARHMYTEATTPFPVSQRTYLDAAGGPLIGMGGINAEIRWELESGPVEAPARFAYPNVPLARPESPFREVDAVIEDLLRNGGTASRDRN